MQEQPLVFVVMATFNELVVIIAKSIESILNQSYQNLELLIADDSYSSETIAVIDAFAARDLLGGVSLLVAKLYACMSEKGRQTLYRGF